MIPLNTDIRHLRPALHHRIEIWLKRHESLVGVVMGVIAIFIILAIKHTFLPYAR
jgi:hypothetical protein